GNLAGFSAGALQYGMYRRQWMKFFTYSDDLACRHDFVGSRCKQRKLNRPAEGEIESAGAQFHSPAFFLPAGDQAQRFGLFVAFGVKADVKRMRRAPANSPSQ